jgi:hypothetical protein
MTASSQTRSVLPLRQSPFARPSTVPQVFRAAARLLAANGLHQGDYCPDPFDRRTSTPHDQRPLSVVAALYCAVSGDPHLPDPLADTATQVLAHRLEVGGEGPWLGCGMFNLKAHVDSWGDEPSRSTESAVAVLEAAADACEVAA